MKTDYAKLYDEFHDYVYHKGVTATEIANRAQRSIGEAVHAEMEKIHEVQRRLIEQQISPPLIMQSSAICPKVFAGIRPMRIGKSMMFTNRSGMKEFTGADMASTEAQVTAKKAKEEKFNTIGVRFPETPGKEYTYKVRIGAKPYLGQELVADTPRGQAVVFVTRIDKKPAPNNSYDPKTAEYVVLKYIDRKAVAL